MQGMKLHTPYHWAHRILAVPTGAVHLPVEVFTLGGPSGELVCPDKSADASKLGSLDPERNEMVCYEPQPLILKCWSRAKVLETQEYRDWRFVPITADEAAHLPENKVDLIREGYDYPPVTGEKDARGRFYFARVTTDRVTGELPWDCMRYTRAMLIDVDDAQNNVIHMVHPNSQARLNEGITWRPDRWRSFQWHCEPIPFMELPDQVREKVV